MVPTITTPRVRTEQALAVKPHHSQTAIMRTVSDGASVRLYHLDEANAAAHTLFYGPLVDALVIARQQPDEMQAALWLATESDVVAFLDIETS